MELRVQPRARRTALEIAAGALKASVTAPPEDGKANDAVIALLSQEWRLPKSAFAVIKGAATRDKTLERERRAREPGELDRRSGCGAWLTPS